MSKSFTIAGGPDHGRRFTLAEMTPAAAEDWARRALVLAGAERKRGS